MLNPGTRCPRALTLIDDEKFFSLVAAHQSGKTTFLRWVVKRANQGSEYRALWVDLQTARDTPDVDTAMRTILNKFDEALALTLPQVAVPGDREAWLLDSRTALKRYLAYISAALPLPLVVMFDEADCLAGAAMVSFLTQLRDGYLSRSDVPFPCSVALVGRRAVRDYTLSQDDRHAIEWLGTSSPFNVNAELTTLELFTAAEVESLLLQHTTATGQRFDPDAIARVHELTSGQPWLVNALVDYATDRLVPDRTQPVTLAHILTAKEALIQERRTHIDALVARLREPRVRRIIDPMLAGSPMPSDMLDDDLAYVKGLGLVRVEQGNVIIANAMYREVVPRALTYVQQVGLYQKTLWYVRPDGLIDMGKLMEAWQEFWREDGHLAAEGFTYGESGPHLMMMAFLQRIVNGGGTIDREYALGKGALDLLITWKTQRIALELKIWRRLTTESKGIKQLSDYLDSLGLHEGWLIIFNPSVDDWDARIFVRTETVGHRNIHVVGC
jgi:hypothetical protein